MKNYIWRAARGIFVVTLALVLLGETAVAEDEDFDEQLAEVDELRDEGEFLRAISRLNELGREHPDNVEIYWRRAWTKVDLGTEQTHDSERDRLFEEGFEEAERALELDPEHPGAHVAMAIAAGQKGLISGTRRQVELSRKVKEHADRALELDPERAEAYHTRARWHHEVASLGFFARTAVRAVYGGLPDASYEAAVEDFERSIELDERIIDRLELGRTYEEMGETEQARAQFERALELSPAFHNDEERQEEARELLDDL